MTATQLEKRRKVAKIIGIGLPTAGFFVPFIANVKQKQIGAGVVFGVLGLIFGAVIAGGVVVAIMPSPEEQDKIR